ncbi:MAG TPA: S9 family peptidase, partial [Ktedonobacterales bacterium]|nr:S9 family peptidase [Ktedonobacterales bacterium]
MAGRDGGYEFAQYLNVRSATGPSFSPDGRLVSFLTDISGVAEVWCVRDTGTEVASWPDQITFRGERAGSATFSPTQDTLLVAGDVGGGERTQLFSVASDGGELVALTHQPEVIHQFGGWSPDGARICFAGNQRDPRFFDVYEMEVASQATRPLLTSDDNNEAAGYSPDGRWVLVHRSESNVRGALFLVDTRTGEARRLTPEHPDGTHERYSQAAFAADGRTLYLLSDAGRDYMNLAALDLESGALTYLRDDPWDAESLAVAPDGTRLAFALNEDGASRLALYDVAGGWEARRELPAPGVHRTPLLPQGVASELVWSRDGRALAFTLNPAAGNPDIWTWEPETRALRQLTRSARAGLPADAFTAPELVHFPTFDGREIPAFLYLPRGVEPRGLPVILYVHGGPESQFRPIFFPELQYYVSRGYGVLAPNVRGSTGYGYTYQSLDDVRLRMDSVADLKAAAEWLAASGIADARRIAIMGRSYGGFMVLAALTTYPDLWAAGVDTVGIASFVTFLENTGPWRRKLREPEYGSLEHDREFLEAISPLNHVDRITAPLFVVHGANDPRVPVGEAEQIVAALRARNVPVEYLRFEDEGHGLIKRANRVKAYPAIARFLDAQV